MKTVGHHACRQWNGRHYVLQEAPFLSEHNPQEDKHAFLGTGYYYWDDDLERAKSWGRGRYNNSYFVVESELDLHSDIFLDLVGSRQDQKKLVKHISDAKDDGYEGKDWCLAKYIEFFTQLNKEDDGFFPYLAIRAHDVSETPMEQFSHYFVNTSQRYIDLSPRYIICIKCKLPLILRTKKIVFEAKF